MTIQIENEQGLSFDFDYEAVARQVIEQVLDMEQCPYEAEVSVTLTGSQEIRTERQMSCLFRWQPSQLPRITAFWKKRRPIVFIRRQAS